MTLRWSWNNLVAGFNSSEPGNWQAFIRQMLMKIHLMALSLADYVLTNINRDDRLCADYEVKFSHFAQDCSREDIMDVMCQAILGCCKLILCFSLDHTRKKMVLKQYPSRAPWGTIWLSKNYILCKSGPHTFGQCYSTFVHRATDRQKTSFQHCLHPAPKESIHFVSQWVLSRGSYMM